MTAALRVVQMIGKVADYVSGLPDAKQGQNRRKDKRKHGEPMEKTELAPNPSSSRQPRFDPLRGSGM
jgi:hypothetical protein